MDMAPIQSPSDYLHHAIEKSILDLHGGDHKELSMKKIVIFSLLLGIMLTGCAEQTTQTNSTPDASRSQSIASSQEVSVPSTDSAVSDFAVSDSAVSDTEVIETEWDFQKDLPVFTGQWLTGDVTLDMDFPILGEYTRTTIDRFEQAGIHLLYHFRCQPYKAIPMPEIREGYYSFEPFAEEELADCYAYLEGLGIPYTVVDAQEFPPINPKNPAKEYHFILSKADVLKLNAMAAENGVWLEFSPCSCTLPDSYKTYDSPVP